MKQIILFIILSIPSVYLSWRSVFSFRNHGFYRFFSWEIIIWLFTENYHYWFVNPLAFNQVLSWISLILSIILLLTGAKMILNHGKSSNDRNDDTLFSFEKTTKVVDTGIYKYIRHPLYSSLIFLGFGIYLKNPTLSGGILTLLSTLFLYITCIRDEKECITYFGNEYSDYMKRSKMFIPYIF